jgi:hypothetical protein
MGELDEDGRPIRGSGALPYGGASGGSGDMSGVTFSRNIFEHPPSQQVKGNFVKDFSKLISDIQAGKLPPADVSDVSGGQPAPPEPGKVSDEVLDAAARVFHPEGTTKEAREIYGGLGETPEQKARRRAQSKVEAKAYHAAQLKKKRQEQMAKARAAKISKRAEREAEERAENARSEYFDEVDREAEQNGGAVAVPESEMSESGERTVAESDEIRGQDQRRGISANGLPDLSRAGGAGSAGVPEAHQDGTAGTQGHRGGLSQEQFQRVQAALIIASQPFHINAATFAQIPFEQAEHLLSELQVQVKAIGDLVEGRRQAEQVDNGSKCTWCSEPFNGPYFARFPFELEVGSGQWRAIYSCRKAPCLAKFNAATEEIQKQLRAEREA